MNSTALVCRCGVLLALAAGHITRAGTTNFVVTDVFGRDLSTNGLTLVDWEGQMANPMIRFYVQPPTNASLPADVILSANGVRLYFDTPSNIGSNGPSKIITFDTATSSVPVGISIFSDHDGMSEDYTLSVQFYWSSTSNTFPIHVVDQDQSRSNVFSVIMDFSQDATGFFDDPAKRAIVERSASDWAYFVDDMHLDEMPAGAESTWIWDTNDYNSGYYTNNAYPFTGYLLYATGIITSQHTSGGGPNYFGILQTSGGNPLPLKCSGNYNAEILGNYNTLGWFLSTGDDDWWRASNYQDEPNDLASISHHEIGHALIFNPAYPRFGEYKAQGFIDDPAVTNYYGGVVPIDGSDHLADVIDPESQKGAFGSLLGNIPDSRWIMTKLDLLVAQAIGYKLRLTSAFVPLGIDSNALSIAALSVPYSQSLVATGGIPFYDWQITSGSLPSGMRLDRFTGTISGQPNTAGAFPFTVQVREYASNSASASFTLKVAPPLRFDLAATRQTNSVFTSRLLGAAGLVEIIEASTNLADWTLLTTNSAGLAAYDFADPQAGRQRRFYRAVLTP